MLNECPYCKTPHKHETLDGRDLKMVVCQRCHHRFYLRPANQATAQVQEAMQKNAPAGRDIAPPAESWMASQGGLALDMAALSQAKPETASRQARRIGVMLSKGGVGKTTTAVNLAAGLAKCGYKVLLVDTDTQGQDGFALGLASQAGLCELVTEEADPDQALAQARENLWLLAGGKSLAGLKRFIDRKDFGGELTLSEALGPLDSRFDYVIVDSSPGWDPLTVNVLFYVREVLIPVSLEVLSLQGLAEFQKSLNAVFKYNKEISLKYIVPTFLDRRVKAPAELLKEIEKHYPNELCEPVRYNSKLSECPSLGQTIFEYAPGSIGAKDYRNLVKRVAGLERLPF